MPVELLLEIGTEEIPSNYLEQASNELKVITERYLKDNRIRFSEKLSTYYTPRRLVVVGEGIDERQEDLFQEITGPPKRAAYDEEGNPTRAATGFAKKYGMTVDDLRCMETPKGEYLFFRREIPGRPSMGVLAEVLPQLIAEIPWPKSMRWSNIGFSFVRPIHWILALLGGQVIQFELAGVRSGRETRGHRFMAPETIEIQDFRNYMQEMKRCYVMIDQVERRKEIEREVTNKAREVNGIPVHDPELVHTVANLVEFPSVLWGSFDEAFLNLPAPVLITAMREHQKYFAVKDKKGRLINHFIAVNNTMGRDESVVQKGHERVLRARLSDAVFFYNEDRKRPLEDRLNDLKGVIYQAELGTSFDKVERFTRLALYLAERVVPEKKEDIKLAAKLSKCDLVTELVTEFPILQGIMGMEYARLDGHPEEVCLAIKEHYLPVRAGDSLPSSIAGTIVGLADRMDTITGCFAIGLEPTGAADPFALRRHALAVIRILEDKKWELSLKEFIRESLKITGEKIDFDADPVFDRVRSFFRERYKNRVLTAGYDSDLVEAILSANFDKIDELPMRIEQLRRFMTEFNEFEAIALTFKRVSNILKNQPVVYTVDQDMFEDHCETALWEAYQGLKDEINILTGNGKYFEAMGRIAELRKPVDAFFDGVEILTKESTMLRNNRLAILHNLGRLFLSLADFSKFSI